jgi:phage baseplate assembly protein W
LSIQGSCLSEPVRADVRGTLAVTGDREQIVAESIMAIVGTRKGERVMLPDYGISDYVFETQDGGFAQRLAFEVRQQVLRYEPLVESLTVRVANAAEDGSLDGRTVADAQRAVVDISYVTRGSNVARNLRFPTRQLSADAGV